MRKLKFTIAIFISIVFIISCNTSGKRHGKEAVSPEGLMQLTQFNDSCMSGGLWTGAVLLSGTLDDGVVFRKSWGHLSVENQIKMPEEAIFDMASLTKPIATVTALAICVDRGLIDVTAPFVQYLPEYKGILMGNATVNDLVRHLAGFDNGKSYLGNGRVVENILNYSPVNPAGQKYTYACVNYILLGLIIERVTGKPLDQFCQTNIFTPLGMKDTHWSPLLEPDTLKTVKSIYTPQLGVVSDEPARMAEQPIGNAGLFSTADDLAKYCMMILNEGRIKGESLLSEKMMQKITIKSDHKSPVTFGWRMDSNDNPSLLSERTLNHTGWTGNSVWIDLKQKIFVIVLTSRTGDHGLAKQSRAEFADHLLKELEYY